MTRACLFLVLFLSLLGPAQAAPLKGQIKLPASAAPKLPRPLGYWLLPNDVLDVQPPLVDPRTEMVVTLEGRDIIGQSLVKPALRLEDMRFHPMVLAVSPHAKVVIENKDPVEHKLEPVGPRKWFPGQTLAAKASHTLPFDTPGSYTLRCSHYPHISATVFVTGAPVYVQPDSAGGFTFPEIRPGSYTLKVWYRDQWIHSQEVLAKPQPKLVEVTLTSLGKE
jgi:plastocyanin